MTPNPKLAAKLYRLAETMQAAIDAKRNPGVARQNLTPRRVRIAESMRRDADRLELIQKCLRTLAHCHEAPALWASMPTMSLQQDGVIVDLTRIASRAVFDNWPTAALERLGGKLVERPEDRVRRMEQTLVGATIPGFFPTPAPVIDEMLGALELGDGHRVLESSAGKGDILDAIRRLCLESHCGIVLEALDAIEINYTLRELLEAKGYRVLTEGDFMLHRPSTMLYDRIVQNPPFERNQDIAHIYHAWDLLAPGGRLVSLAGEGAFMRGGKTEERFREWLDAHGATVTKVAAGAFTGRQAFRQTGVACRMVVIDKPLDAECAQHQVDTRCPCQACRAALAALPPECAEENRLDDVEFALGMTPPPVAPAPAPPAVPRRILGAREFARAIGWTS